MYLYGAACATIERVRALYVAGNYVAQAVYGSLKRYAMVKLSMRHYF